MNKFFAACVVSTILVSCVKKADEVVAVVNGTEIKNSDIENLVKADLLVVQEQQYEIRRKALEFLVERILVENEGKKTGKNVNELLAPFEEIKKAPVTDADLQQVWKSVSKENRKMTEDEKKQLTAAIQDRRWQLARAKYSSELRERATIKLKMKHPEAIVAKEMYQAWSSVGAANAKNEVIVFFDFNCPYSAQMLTVYEELKKKYGNLIKFTFADYPIDAAHPLAPLFHNFYTCSAEQGKAQEFFMNAFAKQADLLKEEKKDLKEQAYVVAGRLEELTKAIGVDTAKLRDCMQKPTTNERLQKSVKAARDLGVSMTPTFIVNGQWMRGVHPAQDFSEIIDQ